MYTTHRTDIQTYESQFSTQFAPNGTTIQFQLISAETTLIDNFAEGRAIDGEVLVGTEFSNTLDEAGSLDLSKNDLMFGEGGNDFMYGHGGADVLYGGAGADTLQGDAGDDHLFGGDEEDTLRGGADNDVLDGGDGDDRWLSGGDGIDTIRGGIGDDRISGDAGNDILEGGAGNDTYYINSLTDGSDTIEDSDATGVIKVDGRVLTGGIKRPGDATFKQGSFEYRLQGAENHLVLTVNGATLTINPNFQNGQFGIQLIDLTTLPDGTAPTIDYNNGYSTTSVTLTAGPPEFNGSSQFFTSAGQTNYVINGNYGPEIIHADTVPFTTQFDAQNQQVYGGAGSDLITGDFNDRLYGEAGIDVISASWGSDVVYGGEGQDWVYGEMCDNQFARVNNSLFPDAWIHDFLNGGGDNAGVGHSVEPRGQRQFARRRVDGDHSTILGCEP
ncbi:MAG: calcium-binding protein [Nitrospirales bacterium]